MSTYNQYFWDDSSLQVKSDVLSYSLFTSNGTRINIKDSKNPIVMRIPRRVPPYPPYEDYTLEMKTNYHEIPILNSSSLHIEILPANYCINFHVLLKYGKHPTNESFIYKGTVPDFSRCKLRAARNISTQICHRYNELASLLNHTNKSMENIDSETRESMDREMMKTISSLCPAMKDSFRLFISDRNTRNGNYYLSMFS